MTGEIEYVIHEWNGKNKKEKNKKNKEREAFKRKKQLEARDYFFKIIQKIRGEESISESKGANES